MTSLLELPQELLLDIVERLEGDNAALAALCLTSRACVDFSRRSLYRSVKIDRNNTSKVQIALLLRTAFDRRDLIALTTTFHIETSIFLDSSELWEVPSGATRMRLANGTRLKDASLQEAKCLERNSAPGVSSMIRNWRRALRSGAQTAYVGLLFFLLTSIKDISITIYVEDGKPTRTVQPLEHLFGLSIGGYEDELQADPRPHLPLIPHMRHVTRLKTSGANLALLCLGFENLETLEIDLSQSLRSVSGPYWMNDVVDMDPCSLPNVHSLVIHIDWDKRIGKDCIQSLFEAIYFPELSHVYCSLYNHDIRHHWNPEGSFAFLQLAFEPVEPLLQELTISVGNDIGKFSPDILCRFSPCTPDLRRFERLHTMCVPSAALVNHSIHHNDTPVDVPLLLNDMPPKLKHLTILYPNAQTLDWLHDTFGANGHDEPVLQTLTLSCAWDWGKPPTWFERRRDLLDSFPVKVIVDVIQGQKKPADYVDVEADGLWDIQSGDDDWLSGLFSEG